MDTKGKMLPSAIQLWRIWPGIMWLSIMSAYEEHNSNKADPERNQRFMNVHINTGMPLLGTASCFVSVLG